MTKKVLFGATVSAVVLGPLLVLGALSSHQAQPPSEPRSQSLLDPREIPRPDGWVAFGSDVEITDDKDPRVLTGKFYQDSNGSTYYESGPNPSGSAVSQDPDHPNNVITIFNIPLGKAYIRGKSGRWESHPLGIDSKQWRPKRYRYNAYVREHPERVLGWTVVKSTNAKNTGYTLMAPGLNFAPLVWRRTSDTRRLLNIQLGDPDPELFLPPQEAEANMLECPEPMISTTSGPGASTTQSVIGPKGANARAEGKCGPSSRPPLGGPEPSSGRY